eukprot:sb/3475005/
MSFSSPQYIFSFSSHLHVCVYDGTHVDKPQSFLRKREFVGLCVCVREYIQLTISNTAPPPPIIRENVELYYLTHVEGYVNLFILMSCQIVNCRCFTFTNKMYANICTFRSVHSAIVVHCTHTRKFLNHPDV